MPKKKEFQNLYVGLTERDHERLDALAAKDKRTKTELGREALQWYLAQRENDLFVSRDTLYASAVKEMTDRVCGMLARQGTALGVLYELAWRSKDDEESRQDFEEIVKEVRSKQRKRLDADEKALSVQMQKVVKAEVTAPVEG